LIGPGWNLFDVRRPVEAKPSWSRDAGSRNVYIVFHRIVIKAG
jgi:hypothetical protein